MARTMAREDGMTGQALGVKIKNQTEEPLQMVGAEAEAKLSVAAVGARLLLAEMEVWCWRS